MGGVKVDITITAARGAGKTYIADKLRQTLAEIQAALPSRKIKVFIRESEPNG